MVLINETKLFNYAYYNKYDYGTSLNTSVYQWDLIASFSEYDVIGLDDSFAVVATT